MFVCWPWHRFEMNLHVKMRKEWRAEMVRISSVVMNQHISNALIYMTIWSGLVLMNLAWRMTLPRSRMVHGLKYSLVDWWGWNQFMRGMTCPALEISHIQFSALKGNMHLSMRYLASRFWRLCVLTGFAAGKNNWLSLYADWNAWYFLFTLTQL